LNAADQFTYLWSNGWFRPNLNDRSGSRLRRCGNNQDRLRSRRWCRRSFKNGSGGLEVVFEILGGDLIQRAGRHLGSGNAQFFGLQKHIFALDSKLLRDLVNTNGHMYLFSTGWKT
jgi:hypothetical protein